jgi:hypothetical protein
MSLSLCDSSSLTYSNYSLIKNEHIKRQEVYRIR